MRTLIALLLSTLPLLSSPNTMQGVQFCPLRLNAFEDKENWLTWSEDLTQASWGVQNGAVVNAAQQVTLDAVGNSGVFETPTVAVPGIYVLSVEAKAAASRTVRLRMYTTEIGQVFSGDLTIGTGWTPISFTVDATAGVDSCYWVFQNGSDNAGGVVQIRNAQLRRATKSSTYVKTEAVRFVNGDKPSVQAWYDPNSPLNTLNGAGMSQLKNLAPDDRENWLLWSEDFTKTEWQTFGTGAVKVGIASGVGPNGEDAMELAFGSDAVGTPSYQQISLVELTGQWEQGWFIKAKTAPTTVRLESTGYFTTNIVVGTSWTWITDVFTTGTLRASIRNNDSGTSGNIYVLKSYIRRASKSPAYVKTEAIRYVVEDRDLNQSTAASQPLLTNMVNGTLCLEFDGTDDYLKTATFPLVQPTTVLGVFEQVSWTAGDTLTDGFTGNDLRVYQDGTTPQVLSYAGTAFTGTPLSPSIGAASVISATFNGANSTMRNNWLTEETGNSGTASANGFTVGAYATGAAFGNIRTADLLLLNRTLTTSEQSYLVQGLARKAGVNIW